MFTFDPINKLIIMDPGVTSVSAIDLYSKWKEWAAESDNAKYAPAFSNSVGGESLGGGIFTGRYFFLQNGWKIRPQEADHSLTIDGNLYTNPAGQSLTVPPLGDYTVTVSLLVSQASQGITVDGTTTDVPTAEEIAQAVWSMVIGSGSFPAGSSAEALKKILQNAVLIPAAL
jgi:hypothetical protein